VVLQCVGKPDKWFCAGDERCRLEITGGMSRSVVFGVTAADGHKMVNGPYVSAYARSGRYAQKQSFVTL